MERKSIYIKKDNTFYENKDIDIRGKNEEKLRKSCGPSGVSQLPNFFVVFATLSVIAHIMSLLILSLSWKIYGCGELQGFPQPLFLVRQYFFRQEKNRK